MDSLKGLPLIDMQARNSTNVITIAGAIGSGKSAVAAAIKRITGWPTLSTGALFRDIAARHKMSVLELNHYALSHPEIDVEVDNELRALANRNDPIIIDSRMAWFFIPTSLKTYLLVDPAVAAKRVFLATRADERYESAIHASTDSTNRQQAEGDRYFETYGVVGSDLRNYDLAVDTTHADPETVAALILERRKGLTKISSIGPELWLSPRRIVPTQNIREMARASALAVEASVAKHGYDNRHTVDVVSYKDSLLAVDGHARISAAIRNGESFIACRILALDSEQFDTGLSVQQFAQSSVSMSGIYDWEDANNFTFESYPSWLQ